MMEWKMMMMNLEGEEEDLEVVARGEVEIIEGLGEEDEEKILKCANFFCKESVKGYVVFFF